jgi:REP element-mobilizing transposase RayT
MARAHRHFLPGQVWHLTHRCHKKEFLLKLVKDRHRWLYWLFEAKKRYGLRILNYIVTSNHIHLLVANNNKDQSTIPRSIQLVAGRTGQEYNQRKDRKGAFWEDRYHATAVQSNDQLIKCIAYIDMNMIRAGVVKHPEQWSHGGYNEILKPRKRYGLIDFKYLMSLLNIKNHDSLKESYQKWIKDALKKSKYVRESRWTESIAVGDKSFIETIKKQLGAAAQGRKIKTSGNDYQLRENQVPYGDLNRPNTENSFYWDFSCS